MRTALRSSCVVLMGVMACSSDTTTGGAGMDGGMDATVAPVIDASVDATPLSPTSVTLAPSNPNLLTCSVTQFMATFAPPGAPEGLTWSASAGMISATGLYTAASQPGTATITATSTSNPQAVGQSTAMVAPIFNHPNSAGSIATDSEFPRQFPHAMASSGDIIYAAMPSQSGGKTPGIKVWRSSDAGKSFTAVTTMTPAMNSGSIIDAISIAVDAGSSDIVYVAFEFSSNTGLAGTNTTTGDYNTPCPAEGSGCGGIGLFVSKDQAKTFSFVLLQDPGGNAGGGIGTDVVSPAAGVVVVSAASDATTKGDIGDTFIGATATGFSVFADTKSGAGLVPHMPPTSTTALSDAAANTYILDAVNTPETTIYPHLFHGGGVLCLSYVAVLSSGVHEPRVQCSTDLGKTFGAEIKPLASSNKTSKGISVTSGAVAFNATTHAGYLSITFTDGIDNSIHVATTAITDGAKPTGAFSLFSTGDGTLKVPVPPAAQKAAVPSQFQDSDLRFDDVGNLWLTYGTFNADQSLGLAVDKSCDGGKTWNGAVFANLTSMGTLDNAQLPGLVPVTGAMAISSRDATSTNPATKFYRLAP